MMYVSQIIVLYTLNLYGAVCRLYLSKTGKNKKDLWLWSEGYDYGRTLETCNIAGHEPKNMGSL